MGKYNEFDKRMKSYENSNKLFLQKKTPVIIRIDGRAFHTFTKGLEKPFDAVLGECMAKTTEYLLNNISGCVFGYTQSDEISLLLVDYQTEGTEPWFDNNQQKLVSISAAMATLAFNRFWGEAYNNYYQQFKDCHLGTDKPSPNSIKEGINSNEFIELTNRTHIICTKLMTAIFDARAFNIPKEEVLNYFIWRQQDATKNSITMLAQAHFSHKALQGKNGKDKQDMLMLEKGINWNDIPTRFKRGTAVYRKLQNVTEEELKYRRDMFEKVKKMNENIGRERYEYRGALELNAFEKSDGIIRNKSYIDYEMPILTQDREFIKGY